MITRPVLKDCVENVINFFEAENIKNLKDVKDRLNKIYPIYGPLEQNIYVKEGDSNQKTRAYFINYVWINQINPIHIRFNSSLNYSRIFLKSYFFFIPEFTPFSMTFEGIISSEKNYNSIDFKLILNELEKVKKFLS